MSSDAAIEIPMTTLEYTFTREGPVIMLDSTYNIDSFWIKATYGAKGTKRTS